MTAGIGRDGTLLGWRDVNVEIVIAIRPNCTDFVIECVVCTGCGVCPGTVGITFNRIELCYPKFRCLLTVL